MAPILLIEHMKMRLTKSIAIHALFWCLANAKAHDLQPVVITGHYNNTIGSSNAASQGVVGSELLHNRALLRPAEVLEFIPGMVVTQHSGDGKANQYFLRGMNLDHGTDFATTIQGVPVNMPTHAHGHGYSDLNILIPELVNRVEYRKGPYFATEGDFSSAGAAHVIYHTRMAKPFVSVTLGQRGYTRGVAALSREIGDGISLLSAVERLNNDGPWTVPQGMQKLNTLFTLSGGGIGKHWSTSLSAYSAHWNASDQIPQRLVEAGSYQGRPFGRFDSLDPSNGATTSRISLSGQWRRSENRGVTAIQWYAIRYDLELYSNFTYALDRATDQFAQTDHRTVLGGQAFQKWTADWGTARNMHNTLGVQWRQDRILLGLYDTAQRQILNTVRSDQVHQTMLGLYGQNEVIWNPWLRTIAGVRADQLQVQVESFTLSENSGRSDAVKMSPKMSVIFGPWNKTEFFLNAGKGFHSNDARGMTARVDPRSGQPIDKVPGLVSSRGQEIGIKTELLPHLQSTLALWQLDFDSELIYVGDAGTTEAGRPSQRTGIEWSNHWTPARYVLIDANLAWTRPRYTDQDPNGHEIVNAAKRVASLTFAIRHAGAWSGSFGIRYIDATPLVEDNSVRASSSLLTHLRVSRKLSNPVVLTVDVLNLANRKNNDISYFYTSRVAGEPAAGVNGVHIHPAEPRTIRVSMRAHF